MINLLINAYAVAPGRGSEPGLGWQWVVNLAKTCNVFVITEGEWRDEIEKETAKLPYSANMHFYYIPVSKRVRRMCWNQGDWRFYFYYHLWQIKAYRLALKICRDNKIDVTHQLNMIGFREPGLLWKIPGVKHVWGPVGGLETAPLTYFNHSGFSVVLKETLKSFITRLQIRYSLLFRRALANNDIVVAATEGAYDILVGKCRKPLFCLNETGCYNLESNICKKDNESLNLLWVGKLAYRKQLHLAIETLEYLSKDTKVILHVVGLSADEEKKMSVFADSLGVNESVVWHSKIGHSEVMSLMQQCDVFFFTSINEGTPHVVLEAIQNGLPVLCFDVCGQGDVVDDSIGRKISVTDYLSSAKEFASVIDMLNNNRLLLKSLSDNCLHAQDKYSWKAKIMTMIDWYKKILS